MFALCPKPVRVEKMRTSVCLNPARVPSRATNFFRLALAGYARPNGVRQSEKLFCQRTALLQKATFGIGVVKRHVIVAERSGEWSSDEIVDSGAVGRAFIRHAVQQNFQASGGEPAFVEHLNRATCVCEGCQIVCGDQIERVQFGQGIEGRHAYAAAEIDDRDGIHRADEAQQMGHLLASWMPFRGHFIGGRDEVDLVRVGRDEAFPQTGVHAVQIVEGIPNGIGVLRFHEEAEQARVEIEIGHQHRLFVLPRDVGGYVNREGRGAAAAASGYEAENLTELAGSARAAF